MKKIKSFKTSKLTTIMGVIVLLVSAIAIASLSPVIFGAGFIGAALWTPSPIIGDIRKKAGSDVFSKNHYGGFIRKLVKPINPRSAAQTSQRTMLKNLAQAWKALTQAQILGWNTLASKIPKANRLGVKRPITGEAFYIGANLNINVAGGAEISDAPALSSNNVPMLADIVITCIAGVISMAYTAGAVATNLVQIKASAAMSGGRTYNSAFKDIVTFASNVVSPKDLSAAWSAKYGTAPVAGEVIFFNIRVIDSLTGFATMLQKFRVICS